MGYSETAEGFTHTVGYKYNSDNNLIELTEDIDGTERTTTYDYDKDNRTTSVTTDGTTVEYTYDAFGRVTQQVTKIKGENEETPDTVILTEYFTYTAPSSTTTSAQVATYRTVGGSYDITYSYTYDKNGNIRTVSDGTNTTTYSYDSANQLIREDNQEKGKSYTWTYDNAGNILSFNTYAYTRGTTGTAQDAVAYGYDEVWGDLLISYDGSAVTYEYQEPTTVVNEDGIAETRYNIGNPTELNGRTYVWEHGRRLKSMTMNGVTWTYTYNNAGLRTGRVGTKTVNGETVTTDTYEYIYNGSQLVRMIKNGEIVDITYDAAGTPLTMTYDEVTYYYITNLQGDVVGLLDGSGKRMITYRYTAYGQGVIFSDESSMTMTLANMNPLGYRGYVMDVGTFLCYCQSRYYDQTVGRFLNADGYTSTGQGFVGNNMFAYCLNNPVMGCDPCGTCEHNGKRLKRCEECKQAAKEKLRQKAVAVLQWGVENIAEPLTKGTQKLLSYIPQHTKSFGITASAAYLGGGTGSIGITYDTDGNIGVIASGGAGLGSPSVSVGLYSNITNANDIYEQNGLCYNIGASGSYEGLSLGGDLMTFSGAQTGNPYGGVSGTVGFGYSPIVGEVHCEATWSLIFLDFNLFDELYALYDAVEEM